SWTGPSAFTSALQNPTRPSSTVAMAGTYSVTITNASGCNSLAGTTTVIVNALPATPTATNTGPYCAGATITLATPTLAGATYAWTGPSAFTSALQNPTRPAATIAMAGTYSITVTVSGCTSLAGTTAVVVNAIPTTPTATNTGPYCVGGTITLATPAVSGAIYSWTGPSAFTSTLQNPTRPAATVAMAGTYSVTVTTGGCVSLAGTTAVVVNALPATPTASNTGPYCAGTTITLATPTVAGATYSWTGPSAFTSALQNPTRPSSTVAMAGTYSVTITNASGCTSLAGTTTVVVNALPATPTATNTGPYCAGATITLATPTVAGATYAWTGPSAFTSALQNPTRPASTLAMAGTYSITITTGGCTSLAGTTTVVVNAVPVTPTATNTGPYCAGATITLATPTVAGATYSWTGPSAFTSALQNPTRPSSTVAMAGTYSVTVTTGGCTSLIGTTAVVVNALPATPTATNTGPYCAGATINLSTPTVGGATYSWTGPSAFTSAIRNATRPAATVAMAGTYSVTVTTGGCTSLPGTTTVVVNPIPAAPTAGSNSPVCLGSTILLTSNTIAGATYSWTGPSAFTSAIEDPSRPTATAGMAGTYSVTVTVSGCTSLVGTTVVAVSGSVVPTNSITASPSGAICAGTSVTFTATAGGGGTTPTYQWQVNGINAGTGGTTFTSSGLLNTDIVTCVLTSSSPCAAPTTATSNAITMIVNPVVVPSVSIIDSPGGAVCVGSSITFTATPTNGGTTPTYQWQVNGLNIGSGGTIYSASSLANSDIVTCVMTSNATCPSVLSATSNAITVVIDPILVPTDTISITSGTNPTCSGQAVTFDAAITNGGSTPVYQWQINGVNAGTGLSTFTSSTLNNGDIVTCILTSNATCVSPASVTSPAITMVVDPTPATPTISQVGTTLTSSSATGNQWYLNGVIIVGATSQNYTFTVNGTYTVVVTTGPCSSAASAPTVIINVGIQDADNAFLLGIFPNPNDGHFTISFNVPVKSTYKLELTNELGQLIYKDELKDYSGTYSKQLSVVEYGKGVYTITLTNDKNEVVKKIIVY
ncbi:MAG: T9SS type A sorting domain-containing protein, partial [Bacteroidetes bacterium]|nr:T9SS type A sorting domain-containing protein [Bacteroidota bacterium]